MSLEVVEVARAVTFIYVVLNQRYVYSICHVREADRRFCETSPYTENRFITAVVNYPRCEMSMWVKVRWKECWKNKDWRHFDQYVCQRIASTTQKGSTSFCSRSRYLDDGAMKGRSFLKRIKNLTKRSIWTSLYVQMLKLKVCTMCYGGKSSRTHSATLYQHKITRIPI